MPDSLTRPRSLHHHATPCRSACPCDDAQDQEAHFLGSEGWVANNMWCKSKCDVSLLGIAQSNSLLSCNISVSMSYKCPAIGNALHSPIALAAA